MNSLFDALPYLQNYQSSFLVIALLALMTMIQNGLTAPLAFVSEEQSPGMPLRFDHSKLSFRVLRTHSNTIESVPIFCITLLVAIVAGVSAGLTNGLAIVFLTGRFLFWGIYYSGIGKVAGGPRTMAYLIGLISNTVLALATLWALI